MRKCFWSFAFLILVTSSSIAAPVLYTSRAEFLAAAGSGLNVESFESPFAYSGTVNFPGFSLTESGPGSNPAIASVDSTLAAALGVSNSIVDGGRAVGFDDNGTSILTNLFSPSVNAFGWDVTTDEASTVTIRIGDISFAVNLTPNSPAFVGLIDTDNPFSLLVFDASGGPNLAFDNALFGNVSAPEPVATPEPLSVVVFGGLLAGGGLAARRRMKKAV